MNWIKRKIDELFNKQNVHDSSRIEELRLNFKSRYHNFKLLLNSNNKSLEIMAEMEQALAGNKVFGMSFIRTNCTAVSVNILTMINNLNKLAPEKYSELYDKFNSIQKELDTLLHQKEALVETRLVIPFEQITDDMSNSVGGKMAKLGEIKNKLNINVPGGFDITAAAYERFIQENDLQEEISTIKSKLRYQERTAKKGFFGSSTSSAKIPVKPNSQKERQRNRGGGKVGHKGN